VNSTSLQEDARGVPTKESFKDLVEPVAVEMREVSVK
jgi:hypothetical protein